MDSMAPMSTSIDRKSLMAEAQTILSRAEQQQRDLSDFECGAVDKLLDLAARAKSLQRDGDGHRSTERGR
jgi:hypothetical protein